MPFCSFADGSAMFDATPIENLFLMEYMYDAPEAALKVYLYARMLALHPELNGTLRDLAKALRMTEEEAAGAFDYWERRGLVRRLTDQPPTYAFRSLRSPSLLVDSALDREMYANRDFNNNLRKLFGDQLIGDHEIRKAADWQNILKFDQDAILRMVAYGIEVSPRKNPKPPSVFKRVDKLAEEWARQGIRTLEQVEAAIDEAQDVTLTLRAVMDKLGIARRETTAPEREAVRKWVREWGFTQEEILEACDATLNARNPTIRYLDAILEGRRQAGEDDYPELVAILRELNPQSPLPSPDEKRRYQALKERGIPSSMMRQAAIQCHRANKYRFDDLEWRLNIWMEEGIDTPERAEAWVQENTQLSNQLRRVFRQAGYDDRRPAYKDIALYRGWREDYPEELILFAAECAKNAGGSIHYMDRLLKNWREEGVATVEQARLSREAHRATPREAPANPALQYSQREYKDEDFGDDFFVDLDKFGSEVKS